MKILFHNSIFLFKVLNYVKQRFSNVIFLLDALMKYENKEQNILSYLSLWNDHVQTVTLVQEINIIYDCQIHNHNWCLFFLKIINFLTFDFVVVCLQMIFMQLLEFSHIIFILSLIQYQNHNVVNNNQIEK